jgi:hypothetical protein
VLTAKNRTITSEPRPGAREEHVMTKKQYRKWARVARSADHVLAARVLQHPHAVHVLEVFKTLRQDGDQPSSASRMPNRQCLESAWALAG